ncbi:MAG: twin-arginine translocation signal domain-containing protein, partial [Thermomicrobiales bacterium]
MRELPSKGAYRVPDSNDQVNLVFSRRGFLQAGAAAGAAIAVGNLHIPVAGAQDRVTLTIW